MKRKKKILNKIIIIFFVFSVFSIYGIPKNDRVPIFIPIKTNIDLNKYNKIVIQQYDIKLPEIKIKYKKIIEDFFLIEFKKNINKKVELIFEKLINTKSLESINPKPDKFENDKVNLILDENIKTNYINSMILSMDMNLKVDERHVISEEKDKYGDKLKSFVKKTVWELKTNIILIDINSGKIVKNYKITKKLSEEKRSSYQYYFKYLFDETMNEFLKKLKEKGHFERRYLLSQLQRTINLPKLRVS